MADRLRPPAALADALQERAGHLAARPIELMYRDWFWNERFATRGREHAHQDGRHHVAYLVEALRLGSPETLVSYARWLRTLLVAHGMCTLDLVVNFARLADAIASENLPSGDIALAYVDAAKSALAYEHGEARGVWEKQARLEGVAQGHLGEAVAPAWSDVAASLHADPRHLLSYLADAVAVARPELLRGHATWAAGALQRHEVPPRVWTAITGAVVHACRSEAAAGDGLALAYAKSALEPQTQ